MATDVRTEVVSVHLLGHSAPGVCWTTWLCSSGHLQLLQGAMAQAFSWGRASSSGGLGGWSGGVSQQAFLLS